MRLETIISIFASLTVASAVPVVHEYPVVPMPTPTMPAIASSSAYSPPYASSSVPAVPVGPYSCPQKEVKQCCLSLAQTSHDIIQPIGELVPLVGGIQISSKVSFQCMSPWCTLSNAN